MEYQTKSNDECTPFLHSIYIYIYIYTITKRIFVVITALECSMGRAYIMINKGLETTQHLMLLQVSCVSSNHQAFI